MTSSRPVEFNVFVSGSDQDCEAFATALNTAASSAGFGGSFPLYTKNIPVSSSVSSLELSFYAIVDNSFVANTQITVTTSASSATWA